MVSFFYDNLTFLREYSTISHWLAENFLKLNDNKLEIMLIGKPSLVARCKSHLNSLKIDNVNLEFTSKATNLGVLFDESHSFKEHISWVFRSSFSYLKYFFYTFLYLKTLKPLDETHALTQLSTNRHERWFNEYYFAVF